MRRNSLVAGMAGLLFLLACVAHASPDARPMRAVSSPAAVQADHDADGAATALRLQARYDDSAANCGSDTRPAFLCSGLLLRSARPVAGRHLWDPKQNNPKPGGMSFSWFRHDAQYGKIAHGYGQGFILIPVFQYAGYPYVNMEVLCAFPIDAATDERRDRGCGTHRSYPSDSGPCQAQDIVRALAWLGHYKQVPAGYDRHNHQCGFATVTSTPRSAVIFALLPTIMKALGDESFAEQNEVVVGEWAANLGVTMPIEAFFYVEGSDGLAAARVAQADFHCLSGVWRPVVRMTLPESPGGRARFVFRSEDQGIH